MPFDYYVRLFLVSVVEIVLSEFILPQNAIDATATVTAICV